MASSILGNAVKRVEDPRFITGAGRYVDDLDAEGVLHLAAVRSQVSHGRLLEIDIEDALSLPGVVAVYTAADLDLKPSYGGVREVKGVADRPVLATDTVRFVGELVAVVVAENAVAAEDGADLVWADIDPLDAVVDPEGALADDATLLFPDLGTNVVKQIAVDDPDPDFFADADVVVTSRMYNQRVAPIPLETNAALAEPTEEGLSVWVGTQNVFGQHHVVARALGIDKSEVRGRMPDMGGGFGAKFYTYPEQILVAAVAAELGRPVKWVESRAHNLTGMTPGRDQIQIVEIGATRDGTITGLREHVIQDTGAYPTFGTQIPRFTRMVATGTYRIPKLEYSSVSVMTNTTPTHAYRGAGRPEGIAMIERILDTLADELGMDPVELRRRNLIDKDAFPIDVPGGVTYDSGDYHAALDRALEMAGYEVLRREQRERREQGDRWQLGIGVSTYVEITAFELDEWSSAQVHEDGTVTVAVGTSAHGQGHETAFAQIIAEQFKIPYTDVRLVQGDTKFVPKGNGTGGSRSLQIGGSAVMRAGEAVVDKAAKIVAHRHEANPADVVVLDGGAVGIAGQPDSAVRWAELAALAADPANLPDDMEPGLDAEIEFEAGASSFPFGAHVSVLEVNTETGETRILRHIAVDDCGTIFNRVLVDGQVHGGVAQGIGQALFEQMQYDEDGNPLTANLVSYILPMAVNIPLIEIDHTETPSPHNPLGAKGIGESGTIGATAAVHSAVMDAIRPLGVKDLDMPATPFRIWSALQEAAQDSPPE